MLRGVNRQIIEVNNTGSKYFERALLFVTLEYSDMTRHRLEGEALRLLESLGQPPTSRKMYVRNKYKLRNKRIRLVALATFFAVFGAACYFFANLLFT